jgi:FixJ family two-component response regulator
MTATANDGQSTVYIVDDDAELCQALEWLIHSVGLRARVFSSANDFLKHVEPVPSGCLVLDVRMPGMSGIELQEQLRHQGIELPIILLTGYAEVPLVVRAMHAGAFDVVQKPFSHQALLDRIHDALAKNAANRRVQHERHNVQRRLSLLSEGEREVLNLLCEGKSNKEIAASLQLTRRAIEARRAKIMRKMQADSLAQLIRMTLQLEPALC